MTVMCGCKVTLIKDVWLFHIHPDSCRCFHLFIQDRKRAETRLDWHLLHFLLRLQRWDNLKRFYWYIEFGGLTSFPAKQRLISQNNWKHLCGCSGLFIKKGKNYLTCTETFFPSLHQLSVSWVFSQMCFPITPFLFAYTIILLASPIIILLASPMGKKEEEEKKKEIKVLFSWAGKIQGLTGRVRE